MAERARSNAPAAVEQERHHECVRKSDLRSITVCGGKVSVGVATRPALSSSPRAAAVVTYTKPFLIPFSNDKNG